METDATSEDECVCKSKDNSATSVAFYKITQLSKFSELTHKDDSKHSKTFLSYLIIIVW